jgi:hypothetical protein
MAEHVSGATKIVFKEIMLPGCHAGEIQQQF